MTIDELKILMEENGIEEEKINEFFSAVEKNYKDVEEKKEIIDRISLEWGLKRQMDSEKDWKRKAAIAAQIISLNLEEYT